MPIRSHELPTKYYCDLMKLELPIRTFHTLYSAGFRDRIELCKATPSNLLRLPNFGRKSLKEVIDALALVGLSLLNEEKNTPALTAKGKELFRKYKDAQMAWEAYRHAFFLGQCE